MSKVKVGNICGAVALVGLVSFVGININKSNVVGENNKIIYDSLNSIYTGLGNDYNLVENKSIPVGDVSYKVILDEYIDQYGMDSSSEIAYKVNSDNVEYVDVNWGEWREVDPVDISEYSNNAVSFKWDSDNGVLLMREVELNKQLKK